VSTFVILGKNGDVCSTLPIAYHEFGAIGNKPRVIVAKAYAPILEGCSYLIPTPFDGDWQDLEGAIRFARRNFSNVIITCTNGNTKGKNFTISQTESSFQLEQWKRAGVKEHFDKWPLVFDQRNKRRERTLFDKHIKKIANPYTANSREKFILVGDKSESSPFDKISELLATIEKEFGQTHKIIKLSEVKAEFIFDLLCLYEKADALVTIETVHVHLSKAVEVPTFALLRDGWRGSMCSSRFKGCLKYSQWENGKLKFIHDLQKAVQGSATMPQDVPKQNPAPVVIQAPKLSESNGINRPISLIFRKEQLTKNTFIIRRTAALGDTLAATCVAKKLGEMGHPVIFQSHDSTHCILKRVPYVRNVQEVNGAAHINLDGAYETRADRNTAHFYDIFIERANEALANYDITLPKTNLCPRMEVSDEEKLECRKLLEKHPKPWILICPRSNHWANRTVPNGIWMESAKMMVGTKFWLGNDAPPSGIVDLKCRHFDNAIKYIACADLLVTVDTGPMHVAAALQVPVIAIEQSSSPSLHLSDQQDWVSIAPPLDCLNCQKNTCPLDAANPPCQRVSPELIAKAVNKRLQVMQDAVSCVVCIYRPTTGNLQRCIASVINQVNEVIIVGQHNSVIPDGAPVGEKIKYVVRPGKSISYGRNANFAARNCNNSLLLFLNDDCFIEPDVVAKLKSSMTDKVGIVSHLYRYPSGEIQHGGKYREAGSMGWGHIDHRAKESRIKSLVEMENVCMASCLVRRKAFFDVEGFDQDFNFYSEDDSLCLQMRNRGWKVMYNPHACAIHIDHQSTRNVIGINDIVKQSNLILERKWGWKIKTDKPIAL
jgi:ADP-heptose:LPS heptosyltransferase/GT2 family glycosyltransferase